VTRFSPDEAILALGWVHSIFTTRVMEVTTMAIKQFVSSFARLVLPLSVLAMPLNARADGDFTVIQIQDIRVGRRRE